MEAAPPFELLGGAHLVTLGLIVGLSLAIPLWARSWPAATAERFAVLVALGLVIYRTGWIFYRQRLFGDPLRDLVPLGVCPLLFYLCAWMLWKRDSAVYEVAYFWTIAGALQAMVTPEVEFAFPHPEYISHFASHGALVLAVFYATLVFGRRPRAGSIPRVLVVTVLYAGILLPLNLLLGTNHMYLVEKPAAASVMDYLGPWPWYIVAAIAAALVFFALSYLPFALLDLARGRARRTLAVD